MGSTDTRRLRDQASELELEPAALAAELQRIGIDTLQEVRTHAGSLVGGEPLPLGLDGLRRLIELGLEQARLAPRGESYLWVSAAARPLLGLPWVGEPAETEGVSVLVVQPGARPLVAVLRRDQPLPLALVQLRDRFRNLDSAVLDALASEAELRSARDTTRRTKRIPLYPR